MRSKSIPAVCGAAVLVALLSRLSPEASAADPHFAPATRQLETPTCDEWVADYTLAARIRLADTPFGAGNGSHEIGPGRLRLRILKTTDPAAPKVELVAYEMHEQFVVKASLLFMHATITTVSDTRGRSTDARSPG